MPDKLTQKAKTPAARVDYSSHLWRVARSETWSWVRRRRAGVVVSAVAIFLMVALFAWLLRGAEAEVLGPVLAGLMALLLAGGGIFAAHLLYLSPRNLCAAKQRQLDAERRQFEITLEKEKQAAQFAVAEGEVSLSKLPEQPLRPLELRQEIDQLIAEGAVLLGSPESTMIGESELWFDDVERFAQRHLSPQQYDQLRASSPPDLAGQVLRHRAPSGDAPISDDEFAIAGRLVTVNEGLKEIREGIRG
jgi:hypothetical protein